MHAGEDPGENPADDLAEGPGTGGAASPTSQAFFDAMYRRTDDPWSFATSPYERARYHDILGRLGDRSFRSGFEPGCSVGVLTEMLAPRCGTLVATDLSPVAVERARERCRAYPQVCVRAGRLPDDLPDGPLDLVVLSEIGYYFTADELDEMIERVARSMALGGLLVAAHWTGSSPDHVLSGSEVHARLDVTGALRRESSAERPGYLLAAYRRQARRRNRL